MPLPAWWEIATPHKDIREGFLDERVFTRGGTGEIQ